MMTMMVMMMMTATVDCSCAGITQRRWKCTEQTLRV
jgi:hypothetical protein